MEWCERSWTFNRKISFRRVSWLVLFRSTARKIRVREILFDENCAIRTALIRTFDRSQNYWKYSPQQTVSDGLLWLPVVHVACSLALCCTVLHVNLLVPDRCLALGELQACTREGVSAPTQHDGVVYFEIFKLLKSQNFPLAGSLLDWFSRFAWV